MYGWVFGSTSGPLNAIVDRYVLVVDLDFIVVKRQQVRHQNLSSAVCLPDFMVIKLDLYPFLLAYPHKGKTIGDRPAEMERSPDGRYAAGNREGA